MKLGTTTFKKLLGYLSEEKLLLYIESNNIEYYNEGELGAIVRYKFLKTKSKLYRRYIAENVTDRIEMSRDVLLQFHTYVSTQVVCKVQC